MVCPYKGTSSYWSTETSADVAWSYEEPLEDVTKIAGDVCFVDADVSVELG